MAIEKALYQAPAGIEEDQAEEIEIEVVDPESMSIKMDGMEIEIEPHELGDTDFDANLAENMTETELTQLGSELTSDVENDENSRKDWADMLVKGLEVLQDKVRCLLGRRGSAAGQTCRHERQEQNPQKSPCTKYEERESFHILSPSFPGCRALS